MPVSTRCLDCRTTEAIPGGSRCSGCERIKQQKRNAQPKRRAYREPAYRSVPLVGRCALCGSGTDLTRDHIVPLAKGGANVASNIRILCRSCNSSRGARC